MTDLIHNKELAHMTKEELIDLIKWYEKALKSTINTLASAMKEKA